MSQGAGVRPSDQTKTPPPKKQLHIPWVASPSDRQHSLNAATQTVFVFPLPLGTVSITWPYLQLKCTQILLHKQLSMSIYVEGLRCICSKTGLCMKLGREEGKGEERDVQITATVVSAYGG